MSMLSNLIYEAKTKALISCAVTLQLICAFGFLHIKQNLFSQDTAQIILVFKLFEHMVYKTPNLKKKCLIHHADMSV